MRRHRGLTLVETLVSITLLAIGIVAAVNCLSAALASNLRAERIALATEYGQNAIENMRSSGDLTSYSSALNATLLPAGTLTATVSDYNTGLNLKRLQVQVSWKSLQGRTESVRLDTIVGKRAKHTGG